MFDAMVWNGNQWIVVAICHNFSTASDIAKRTAHRNRLGSYRVRNNASQETFTTHFTKAA